MCSLVSPPISVPPIEAPVSMRGRPGVKYKGELDAQNNPQHTGWLPITQRFTTKRRARQRGSKLKGQIEEGQIGDLELCSLTEGATLGSFHTEQRLRAL